MRNISDKICTKLANIAGYFPGKIRTFLYRRCGLIKLGEKKDIRKHVYFDHVKNVIIGTDSFVNQFVQFHIGHFATAKISIGERTYIGMNTVFCCVTHEIGDEMQRAGKDKSKDIVIGSGVWIGAGVIVLPGVVIGDGCIIGAGAVVTKSCEKNCLYAGNPAKKIKSLC